MLLFNKCIHTVHILTFEFVFADVIFIFFFHSQKLDEIISTDSIFNLRWLPMVIFERELWNIVKGKTCLSESDRRKNFDWESKNYFVYHCYVDLSGNTYFKVGFSVIPLLIFCFKLTWTLKLTSNVSDILQ